MTHLQLVPNTIFDAERAVLGAVLLAPVEALADIRGTGLVWQHFAEPRHQLVYVAMLRLERQGSPIDPITLAAYLERAGKLDEAGGPGFLGELLGEVPTHANVRYHAALVRDAALARDGDERGRHEEVQRGQVGDALDRLQLPSSAYLRLPWSALDAVMGGIAPAGVHFFCARSGSGKTSFLLSLMCRLHAAGKRIYYAGLESQPQTLRLQWAARVVGCDPGDVLSGEIHRQADGAHLVTKLRAELEQQRTDAYHAVRFSPHATVDQSVMAEICVEAAHFGADILVIDHIDHITADGSPYQASRKTTDTLLKLTQKYDLRSLVASQINREGLSTDRFRNHRPVREEHVKMGDHKLEIADTMWGIYRPLKDIVKMEEKLAIEDGKAQIDTVLARGVMALNCMKHRAYGSRAGSRVQLGFYRGDVLDAPELTHGIATHRRTFA